MGLEAFSPATPLSKFVYHLWILLTGQGPILKFSTSNQRFSGTQPLWVSWAVLFWVSSFLIFSVMNLFPSRGSASLVQNPKFSCKNVSCNKGNLEPAWQPRGCYRDEVRASACVYMTPNIQLKSEKLKQPSRCFVCWMPSILMFLTIQMFGSKQTNKQSLETCRCLVSCRYSLEK